MNKNDILSVHNELTITENGDFVVRNELIEQYRIIDFHTHIYECIYAGLPSIIRRKTKENSNSFFDLSCYPGGVSNFSMNKIGYRTWPETVFSKEGMNTLLRLYGKGVLSLIRSATIERLIHDMEKASIAKSVVLPINTINGNETGETNNAINGDDQFILFGSVHPFDKNIEQQIDQQLKMGIKGFKINPHVWGIDFDSPEIRNLIGLLNETQKPIISCSGIAIPQTFRHLPKGLWKNMKTQDIKKFLYALKQFPDIKLIFAHGGLEQNKDLIKLMEAFPNAYSDISIQPSDNIQNMIQNIGYKRLLFGSDYPFFNQAFPILSVLKATSSEIERKAIFSDNAELLLG